MADSIPSIDEQFAQSLPDNPRRALIKIVETFEQLRALAEEMGAWNLRVQYVEAYLSIYALSRITTERLKITKEEADLEGRNIDTMRNINDYFDRLKPAANRIKSELFIEEQTATFSKALNVGHYYEFSDEELTRIQQLLNELRDIVVRSTYFDDSHKHRLLKRLERLQTELHKNMSDLDRFWGLIGDGGVALGKFGNDAKPFFDRIRELGEIVWRAQGEAEKLPEGIDFPLLSDKG